MSSLFDCDPTSFFDSALIPDGHVIEDDPLAYGPRIIEHSYPPCPSGMIEALLLDERVCGGPVEPAALAVLIWSDPKALREVCRDMGVALMPTPDIDTN